MSVRDNFSIAKFTSKSEFKVFITCPDFLNTMSMAILQPITSSIKKNYNFDINESKVTFHIDSDLYKEMLQVGTADDIMTVCSYLSSYWLGDGDTDKNKSKINLQMFLAFKQLAIKVKTLPVHLRKILADDPTLLKILSIPASVHLLHICNISDIVNKIKKMDKSNDEQKYLYKIAEIIDTSSSASALQLNGIYKDALNLAIRILDDIKTSNIIDLRLLINKDTSMIKDSHSELIDYYTPMLKTLDKIVDTNGKSLKDKIEIATAETEENAVDFDNVDIQEAGFLVKKLKRISADIPAYVRINGMNARDADELTMVVSYAYSKVELCDWYIELLETNNINYLVPQRAQELKSIKSQILAAIHLLLKNPKIDRAWNINVSYDSRSLLNDHKEWKDVKTQDDVISFLNESFISEGMLDEIIELNRLNALSIIKDNGIYTEESKTFAHNVIYIESYIRGLDYSSMDDDDYTLLRKMYKTAHIKENTKEEEIFI
jgi:hypothetical protein